MKLRQVEGENVREDAVHQYRYRVDCYRCPRVDCYRCLNEARIFRVTSCTKKITELDQSEAPYARRRA
jgi:hypothetical protein